MMERGLSLAADSLLVGRLQTGTPSSKHKENFRCVDCSFTITCEAEIWPGDEDLQADSTEQCLAP